MADGDREVDEGATAASAGDERFVFNLVWTGTVFDQLQLFTTSLLATSGVRVRFVANQCPPDQVAAMERYAERSGGRVVEVVDVSPRVMVRHGDALDVIRRTRDDGAYFCFVDPDICMRGPFLPPFAAALDDVAVVTSGKELWSDDNVRPADKIGVSGEYFFDQDGFVFGSPHFAMYRKAELEATVDRWGVGFATAGNDLPAPARARLVEFGRDFWIYDTAKVVNILLQADGHGLRHLEHPDLVHIGGVSHFLAPPLTPPDDDGTGPKVWGNDVYDWGKWEGQARRYLVAGHTAACLRSLFAGDPVPPPPPDAPATMADRLRLVEEAMTDLVDRYGVPSTRTEELRR